MTTKFDMKAAAKSATDVPLETTRQYAERQLSDGAWAMREKKTNPEVYEAGRRDQIRLGLRHASVREQNQAIRLKWDKEAASKGSLTAAQVAAIAEYPEPKCKAMTASQAQELKTTDPARYQRYRLAAATFDILPKSLLDTINVPDQVVENEILQTIPSVVAAKLNIDPSLKLSKVGMDRAMQEYDRKVVEDSKGSVEA